MERLFHRLGRSVELTDAGQAFVGPGPAARPGPDAVFESVAGVRDLAAGRSTSWRSRRSPPTRSAGWSAGSARPTRASSVRIAAPDDDGAVDAMVLDGGGASSGSPSCRARRDELVASTLERQEIVAVCPPRTRLAASGRSRRAAAGHAAGHDAARHVDPRPARPGAGLGGRRAGDRGRDLAAGGDRAARAARARARRSCPRAGEAARRAGRGRRPAGADADPHDRPRAPAGAAHARGAGVRRAGPARRPPRQSDEPGEGSLIGNHRGCPRVYRAGYRKSRGEIACRCSRPSQVSQMPTAEEALPGRAERPFVVPDAALRAGHSARAAVPRGVPAGDVRDGLLLGCGAQVLGGRRRVHDRGGLHRWLHAEPDVRRGV